MKKILSLFVLTQLFFACSSDNLSTITDTSGILNADELSSSTENYRGVFTTVDGSSRGVLDVSFSKDGAFATGTLSLSTGEDIVLLSSNIINNENGKSIFFVEDDIEFILTTSKEGEVVEINSVTYKGIEGSLLIAQNTSKAPVTPITGTYDCTNCGGSVNNMGTQTFNLMFTEADGAGSISSQTTLGMTIYNGIGVQTACSANGIETTCTITSGDGVSNIAFEAGGGPVTWSGNHTFNNEPTGINDCSGVTGTWTWVSANQGIVSGTFISDNSCSRTVLAVENWDGASPSWGFTSDTDFFINDGNGAVGSGADGFYGIVGVTGTPDSASQIVNNPNISDNFLFVNDLDDEGDNGAAQEASITFENIDVTGQANVTVSFDYDIIEFGNGDRVRYIVFFDENPQPSVFLAIGQFGGVDVAGTVNVTVPNGTTSVGLQLFIEQNGTDRFAGFDNFKVIAN